VIDLEAMRARNNNRREYEGPGDWCEEYSASCAVDDIDALLAEVERLSDWRLNVKLALIEEVQELIGAWISVDDQMPPQDEEREYIVVIDGRVTSCWYFPHQGSWETDNGFLDQHQPSERVTHWRRLPTFSADACGKAVKSAENA
jgi:hypothetical protein